MPRNGSGAYSLPAGNPVVTQTLITSGWANTTLSDIAVALTNSLSKDGQTLPVANIPMGGFRIINLGDPTARTDAATLGFVQDGRHIRLNTVAGTNSITANLTGGSTSFVTGQIVQLIPENNNTGPVTLAINGGGANPILTAAGNPLGAGNLIDGKPYLLTWDGTRWQMVATPDSSSFAQAAMSGWDRPTSGGGLYPDITIVNGTTIAIPAGTGRLIVPGARDIAGVKEVSWSAQNVVLTNLPNAWATTIAIDENGAVVQLIGSVQSSWARTNIILGTAVHVNGTVTSVTTRPAIFGDMSYAAYDLSVVFNNMLVSGGQMRVNGTSPLHLDIKEGAYWIIGGNPDQTDSPNLYSFNDQIDIQFYTVTGNNTVAGPTGAVPVTNYDPNGAGTVVAIPGAATTAVIHRLYMLVNQFMFVYGQKTYTDLDTALSMIGVDSSDYLPPSRLADATLIGYIIAQKNCTNLGDTTTCRLVNTGGSTFSIGSAGSIADAPLDGKTYGRKNGAWVTAVDQVQAGSNVSIDNTNVNKPIVSVPSGNIIAGEGMVISGSSLSGRLLVNANLTFTGTASFRNKVINGNFDVWQRGTTVNNPSGVVFVADRWGNFWNGGALGAVNRQAFTFGQTAVPWNPKYYHQINITTASTPNDGFVILGTRLESVAVLGGQTATLSFWAKADANRQISVELSQSFGSGGGASPEVTGIGATKVSVNTTWQKFTITVSIPSISGKTIGTNGVDGTNLNFWLDSGSDYNARNASLGHQTGIFDIAQIQLEIGTVATPFENRLYPIELSLCQRYLQTWTGAAGNSFQPFALGYVGSTSTASVLMPLTVTMFGTEIAAAPVPTVTIVAPLALFNNGAAYAVTGITADVTSSAASMVVTIGSASLVTSSVCMLACNGSSSAKILLSREITGT